MKVDFKLCGEKPREEVEKEETTVIELYSSVTLRELEDRIGKKRAKTRNLYYTIFGILHVTTVILWTVYFSFISFSKTAQLIFGLIYIFTFIPCLVPYWFWLDTFKALRHDYYFLHDYASELQQDPQFVGAYKNGQRFQVFSYGQCLGDIIYVSCHIVLYTSLLISCVFMARIRYQTVRDPDGFEVDIIYCSFCLFFCLITFKLCFKNLLAVRKVSQMLAANIA